MTRFGQVLWHRSGRGAGGLCQATCPNCANTRVLSDVDMIGFDVEARMPALSTYLGHVHPANTYWYLSGAPELLNLAAALNSRFLGHVRSSLSVPVHEITK